MAYDGKLYWYIVEAEYSGSDSLHEFAGITLASDDISATTFLGANGVNCHIVNGEDDLILYSGSGDTVSEITQSSTPAITGAFLQIL